MMVVAFAAADCRTEFMLPLTSKTNTTSALPGEGGMDTMRFWMGEGVAGHTLKVSKVGVSCGNATVAPGIDVTAGPVVTGATGVAIGPSGVGVYVGPSVIG